MDEIGKPEIYAKLYLELLSFGLPKLKSIDFKDEVRKNVLEEKLNVLHRESMKQIREESAFDGVFENYFDGHE